MKKTSGRRSRSRKKRREQIAVFAVLVVTVLIAVAGAAWFLAQKNTPSTEHMDASAYFNVPSAEEVTVCVTGTVCERKALRGTR